MEDKANVSREEQIGFHKGALSTLAKEREEMSKIISIVEQLMQMHINALKELGVDLVKQAEQSQNAAMSSNAPQNEKKATDKLDELIKK